MTEDCDASKIYYGLWFSNKWFGLFLLFL
jgi:hypothetical protein